MDNIFGEEKRRKFSYHGLSSYIPFHKGKIKNFKEDEEDEEEFI